MQTTVKHKLSYGISEIISYRYGDRQWHRIDRYTPNNGEQSVTESRFCTGKDDVSRPHNSMINHGYDSRCACCYLNIDHTEDYHNKSVNPKAYWVY